jgi:hypothetical protein
VTTQPAPEPTTLDERRTAVVAAPVAEAGTLDECQTAVVAALVAGAPAPPGFNPDRVRAAAAALLRKRAGEVADVWPALAASYGRSWPSAFGAWAAGRPPAGSLRDGWNFARSLPALTGRAADELAYREAHWRYDGESSPVPRRAKLLHRFRLRFRTA